MTNYMIAALEAWGGIFCLSAAAFKIITRKTNYLAGWEITLLLFSTFLLMYGDLIAWANCGLTGVWSYWAVRIGYFVEFEIPYILLLLLTRFVSSLVSADRVTSFLNNLLHAFFIIATIMTCVSACTEYYYYFDELNYYHRGKGFVLSQIIGLLMIGLILIFVVYCHKALGRKQVFLFLSYFIFPCLSIVATVQVYSTLQILNIGIAVSALLMFVGSIFERQRLFVEQREIMVSQKEELLEAQQRLNDMQLRIVLSQIQPHFLYNSLNAIYYLCEKDPKTAQSAISDFSDYLRGNMDSLKSNDLVPFTRELEHVQRYLSLEKMRFEEELQISYDIHVKKFRMPSLSLQPVVENAVKHGVGKAPDGGTVKIRSFANRTHYVIRVEDDGVGFDPQKIKNDGRSHIGIDNVRDRLQRMCAGTLEITTQVGIGTIVTIRIPKTEETGLDKKKHAPKE